MAIPIRVIKIVYGKSGNRCAFPQCNQELIFKEDSKDYAQVSELAHIKGDKPNSARHDSQQSVEERNSEDNLILLCNTHHKQIDDQEDVYTVEKLQEMKKQHEEWINKQYCKAVITITFSELRVINKFIISNTTSGSEILVVHPKEKIDKNKLSPEVENLIIKGMAQTKLVGDYIDKNPDPEFGERLRQGFINEYKKLKEELDGDNLFYALLDFACGNSSSFKEKAAGLTVLCYFFEKCDIFEK